MIYVKALLVFSILVAGIAAAPDAKKSKEEIEADKRRLTDTSHVDFSGEIPIVVAKVNDAQNQVHEFLAPYYDPKELPLPQEVMDFSSDVITKVMAAGKEIIESALIKSRNKYSLGLQLGKTGVSFLLMSVRNQRQSKQLEEKYHRANDDEFQDDALKLLPELIMQAREELESADKEDKKKYSDKNARKEIGNRILLIFDGVKQLVLNSPVGTHLNFRKVTIDGELMVHEAVEYIKFMQKSGLGWVINIIYSQCEKIAQAQKKQADEEKLDEGLGNIAAPTVETATE